MHSRDGRADGKEKRAFLRGEGDKSPGIASNPKIL